MIDIDKALERVPAYDRFLTLREMYAKAEQVVAEHPGLASLTYVGHSTDGERIPMVRIGDGEQRMLLFASPHPNEPIGAMLVQFLLDELVVNDGLRAGRTWYLLPCVDPDGTRLNEGWFAGPFTIRNYARNFFRPRSQEQVEWTFPMSYKEFQFDSPISETRALMQAFEIARPQFVYSLHNAGFGGVYYYISHDIQDAYDDFRRIPTERDLVLSLGEPEMPWAVEFSPAVYKEPSVRDHYDYLEQFGTGSPAAGIQGGGSSFDYLVERGNPVMLVSELPYFQSTQIADLTPTTRTRRDIILTGLEKTAEMMTSVKRVLDLIEGEITDSNRYYRTVRSFVDQILGGLGSQRAWAESASGMGEPATVAQEIDELYIGPFYRLLVASMLRRGIGEQLALGASDSLIGARDQLEGLLEGWTTDIEAHLHYEAIAIKKLVEVQYGAMLALLNSKQFNETLAAGAA